MRKQDWEHRLSILAAWRRWKKDEVSNADRDGYNAVFDGCAVTIRALFYQLSVSANFSDLNFAAFPDRYSALNSCFKDPQGKFKDVLAEDRSAVLEVLYLGNRAVAHPKDGHLDHKAGKPEMTRTVRSLLDLLTAELGALPGLDQVNPDYLSPGT